MFVLQASVDCLIFKTAIRRRPSLCQAGGGMVAPLVEDVPLDGVAAAMGDVLLTMSLQRYLATAVL